MPQFILTIDLGNDAMCRASDIAGALRVTASMLDVTTTRMLKTAGKFQIRDDNGNVVGHYEARE